MEKTERKRIKRNLMSWGTGHLDTRTGSAAAATAVVADSGHLPGLRESGVIGTETLVVAPPGEESSGAVTVSGAIDDPGAEICIGDDFYLQIQDYATSQFMSVLGPTLARICGTEDFAVFLEDADTALAEGLFPEFATAPSVRIADMGGLGARTAADGPLLRLYVGADGGISTSVGGLRLGETGDGMGALQEAWDRTNAASAAPCAVCLGAAVPEEERAPQIGARPWLGRYLAALDGIRQLAAREIADVRVSGFGGRFLPALDNVARPADMRGGAAPLLLQGDDGGGAGRYVYLPDSERVFRVGPQAAEAIEAVLATGGLQAAAEFAAPEALSGVQDRFAAAGVVLAPGDTDHEPAGSAA